MGSNYSASGVAGGTARLSPREPAYQLLNPMVSDAAAKARATGLVRRYVLDPFRPFTMTGDRASRVETAKKSTDHLLALIDAWARVVRIEQFFEDAAKRAAATSAEEDRSLLLDRIALARDLIGKSDALEHLRTWRSPAELLRAAGVDADQ